MKYEEFVAEKNQMINYAGEGFDAKILYPWNGDNQMTHGRHQMMVGLYKRLYDKMMAVGASDDEMARISRYFLTLLDAFKHRLDTNKCYIDNNIGELKEKYYRNI